ncbi:type I polyketide synthase [uncultured Amphritea sp.]|uniref:type I polyketide synthase n=1 Tax=uncultured Amphritea sp. TaxID=981605 RepID=UPI0026029A92|nr:type I polyketide synthase [uncultured Amphritea sp.]
MDKRVALIGYSYRLPQTSPDAFWQDLLDGKDLITEVEQSRWSFENHLHPDRDHPGSSYTFKAGSLGDISGFDASFFGISPREAAVMDPQQRYLLEMTWEAIEHAGIPASSLKQTDCGVYIGISSLDYGNRMSDDLCSINASTATGNTTSIASNRISYSFDLHGPSISMDTACSSSMVAFHQACQAILNGEVSSALTGGISLHLHPFGFIIFSKATMLSPDGRCKVFDESANGYVRSEGGGIFLLKDYDQAVADGDQIHAIVAASSVNTDGYKSGITIPSCHSQGRLMEQTYLKAGLTPDDLDYLEAHGTGTPVGDPIETRAIGNALGKKRKTPLPIGSVKSNLGHLEPASGVASLVKALLIIKHRKIPATISMKHPNPNIKFDEWNIHVVDKLLTLEKEDPLNIGINSFGFGGANAHVILQSAPDRAQPSNQQHRSDQSLPLIISGRSDQALIDNARRLADFLEADRQISFYDVAWNYNYCKERHSEAALLYAMNAEEAISKLNSFITPNEQRTTTEIKTGKGLESATGAVFIYSGNGCQWETMGKALLETSDVFCQTINKVDGIFRQFSDFSLVDEIKGLNGTNRFEYTEVAQPVLFAIQVGITEYLKHQGVTPVCVTGHSVGEVAAAWASGALTLNDAVKVIYYRSLYQGTTKGNGAMTAASLSQEQVETLLQEPVFNEVHLAGINSFKGVTLAGNPDQLTVLEARLQKENIFNVRLKLDYAFHSQAMDPIESELLNALSGLKPSATNLPFISTVSGTELDGQTLTAEYWWHNIRQPVLFCQALDTLLEQGHTCFIEIGGHPVLRSYLNDQIRQHNKTALVIPTFNRNNGTLAELETSAAAAVMAGAVDMHRWFPIDGNRLELPLYAFQHERHWHPITIESHRLLQRHAVHPLLGAELPLQPLRWEHQIDTELHPWLADHKVGDSVVFPGAGFIELALNAADRFQPAQTVQIEDLEILLPLILEQGQSKVLQTSIDQVSGDISILSRNHIVSEQWALNCKARGLHQCTGNVLKIAAPYIPGRDADFNEDTHRQLALQAGLQYGPAFSAVDFGWSNDSEVLAQLKADDSIAKTTNEYLLHPGILDSAIQLVVHFLIKELEQTSGTAFIPIRVDRITIDREIKKQPTLAHLKLLKKSSHSLLTRLELFDDLGACIAILEGVRFKSVRLYKSKHQKMAYLNYHLTPAPALSQPASGFQPALTQALLSIGQQQSDSFNRFSNEVAPLLESMILHAMYENLQTVQEELGSLNIAELEALQLRDPDQLSLQPLILKHAKDLNLLTIAGETYELNHELKDSGVSSSLIWNTLLREYPDFFSLLNLAGRSSLSLAQKMLGNGKVTGIKPEESYSRLFRDLSIQTCYPLIASGLTELLQQQQRALQPGQRLRVLEVASSQTHFGHIICSQINFNDCDYSFATPNATALESFHHLREQYPLAAGIDLADTDASTVATEGQPFQLIVISLDSYRIQDNLRLLQHIKPLMAEGACLLLYGMSPIYWLDLCFGDTPDWLAEKLSNQATAEQWAATLKTDNLSSIDIISNQLPETGFFLICGSAEASKQEQPEEIASHWLIVSNQNEPERFLLDKLAATKTPQTVIQSASRSALIEKFIELQQSGTDITDVILLSQTDSDEAPLISQTERCTLATDISMAMEQTNSKAQLWVLTEGVGATLPCDHPIEWETAQQTPADAALWGFTRTLMNESLNTTVRLIDLPTVVSESSVDALIDELQHPSDEQELVISPDGSRFAPRLRTETKPGTVELQTEDQLITLGFELPGQLRNLKWQTQPQPVLTDDDIEVEVMATGLNFRDVMYALGLLSDEAIENGYAGATLGLEFSGRVLRTGKNVTDFSTGDNVVGSGSSCFSNRLIAKSTAIAQMPEGLSFEGAATIPTTFLTVYYALHYLARLQPGEKVLIHGAAGGVGIAAIQIAQWLNADIYATVGSDDKREFLELLGIPSERIYNSRTLTFGEEILRDIGDGKGIDVVLNSLSGEAINQNFRVLKPFGRFLELGKRDFYENTHIGLRPFRNNISYFGIDADQLQLEMPELSARLFKELMDLFRDGTLFPLPYTQFNAHQVIDAFRYMQQAKQIGKIVVTYEQGLRPDIKTEEQAEITSLQLSANATYMVTGGLGGFGLRTAKWLIEKGAKHLLLVSRRGASSEEAVEFLLQCQTDGIAVRAEACDVTDRSALARIIALCGNELPELKGVIHAATVINDSLIRNLNEEQIRSSLAAKLCGAEYLDELTRAIKLDLFVVYSSVTTLLGNPGQAAYVAANSWLEALTATRRSLNLPATCVRWGAIEDVGFLTRNEEIKEALQSRLGGNALSSESALNVLEQMIIHNIPNLGVMELDWHTLSKFLPTASQNKFREISLRAGDSEQSDVNTLDLKAMMRDMTESEFNAAILEILTNELSEILMIPAAKIDPNKSIYDMGMDSLMGVELMTALESRMGIQVPVMALTETPMLSQLTNKIIDLVKQEGTNAELSEDSGELQRLVSQHGEVADAEFSAEILTAINQGSTNHRIHHK